MIHKRSLNKLRIRKNIPSQNNFQGASASGDNTQTNINLICLKYYVLFKKQLKQFQTTTTTTNAFKYKSDHISGNVVNLSKHAFSFDAYNFPKKLFILHPHQKDIVKINCLQMYKISFD